MGFISKLIPSVIAGGLGFWILTLLFENLYFQVIGSLVIAVIMFCILSIPGKKKKVIVKKDEPQKQTKEEDK